MPDMLDDVAIDMCLARAGNAGRFVERDVDVLFLRADRLSIDAHIVALGNLRPEHGGDAVAAHPTLFDPLVGLATRAGAGLTDIFVESHRIRMLSTRSNSACGAALNGSSVYSAASMIAACAGRRSMGAPPISTRRRTIS